MNIEIGDEYFIGNCLYSVIYKNSIGVVLLDTVGNQLPFMNYTYLSKCIVATQEEKLKRQMWKSRLFND